MQQGLLMVRAVGHGAVLVTLASADCEVGPVAYEMELLGEQAGHALNLGPRAGRRLGQREQGRSGSVSRAGQSVVHGVAGQVAIIVVRHQFQPPAAFHVPAT
jgi:hypothetical protein